MRCLLGQPQRPCGSFPNPARTRGNLRERFFQAQREGEQWAHSDGVPQNFSQLAKSNEKFVYGAVRQGGRARNFEESIEWLVSAGMLNRIYNVSKMEHPLSAFDKLDQFKLFLFDTGLLKHMAGIDNSAILLKADYQFKGPLTENYVLQQLRGQFAVEPRYYSDKAGEIDFLLQNGTEIIPIEAKGGEDKSAPSFKRFIANRHPEHAIRFSKRGYRRDGEITNIPLYLARKTKELL